MKGSFFTPLEECKGFISPGTMFDQEGIYVTWTTNPKAVAKIVPPPLVPLAPVVFTYIINIQKATFCSRYTEAAMGIPCLFNGKMGIYWLSFLLGGPGAEMGTHLGREVVGIPKKMADNISLNRMGKHVVASCTRHGVKLIDIDMEITGEYPNAAAAGVLGDPKPGDQQVLPGYFLNYAYRQRRDGSVEWRDMTLSEMEFVINYHDFTKGSASVTLGDSYEDPWSELEVVEVLGAGYMKNDIDLCWSVDLHKYEGDGWDMAPYFMSGRFDKGALTQGESSFC